MAKQTKTRGFSIVELAVVMAIVGTLATLTIVISENIRARTRDNIRISDLQAIRSALELYYAANNRTYPDTEGLWLSLYDCYGNQTLDWIPGLVPPFIPQLPRDPRNNTACGDQYIYQSDGKGYKILSQNPENCAHIITNYPALIDPVRGCPSNGGGAMGFWTPEAVEW